MESWIGNPVEEKASNDITLIQHNSLTNSITSSDRQDLMITSRSIAHDISFQHSSSSKSFCNAVE